MMQVSVLPETNTRNPTFPHLSVITPLISRRLEKAKPHYHFSFRVVVCSVHRRIPRKPRFLMQPAQQPHKLSRSRLSRSPLRTLRTTPSLKNFSSPPAVRPPMYHLSAPSTSRNPSLLESLPRLRSRWFGIGTAAGPRGEVVVAMAMREEDGPEGPEDDGGGGCWWRGGGGDEAGWYLFGWGWGCCCCCGGWEETAAEVMEGDVCCRRAVKKLVRKKERWEGIAGAVEAGMACEVAVGA